MLERIDQLENRVQVKEATVRSVEMNQCKQAFDLTLSVPYAMLVAEKLLDEAESLQLQVECVVAVLANAGVHFLRLTVLLFEKRICGGSL